MLWDVLQENAYPGYGYFMEPTAANPSGFTTIGERWTRGSSKNHMILAQIEEWFHEGLAGIREAEGSLQYRKSSSSRGWWATSRSPRGSYRSPQGLIRSEWVKKPGRFDLTVEIPPNTSAEVWVPKVYKKERAPERAKLLRTEDGYTVYRVGSGLYAFASSRSGGGRLTAPEPGDRYRS